MLVSPQNIYLFLTKGRKKNEKFRGNKLEVKYTVTVNDNKYSVTVNESSATATQPKTLFGRLRCALRNNKLIADVKVLFDGLRNTGLAMAVAIYAIYGVPQFDLPDFVTTFLQVGIALISILLMLYNCLWVYSATYYKGKNKMLFFLSVFFVLLGFAYILVRLKALVLE